MNHFKEILDRTKTESLINYLLTGTSDRVKSKDDITYETYDKKIDAAYEYFLTSLENLFPDANRENEELIVLIADFFTKITDVYMEVGFLSGIQLQKNLEQNCWKFGNRNMPSPTTF